MPNTASEENYDRVQVTVVGANRDQLRQRAKAAAAEFFGVDEDSVTLQVSSFLARPHIVDSSGSPVQYKMTTHVYYKVEIPAEHEEPVGYDGPVTVPRRIGRRPSGPPPIDSGSQAEAMDDDDDIDDEAEGD